MGPRSLGCSLKVETALSGEQSSGLATGTDETATKTERNQIMASRKSTFEKNSDGDWVVRITDRSTFRLSCLADDIRAGNEPKVVVSKRSGCSTVTLDSVIEDAIYESGYIVAGIK